MRRVQDNAAALGIIGAVGLAWSSLSFFSSLESALNIVYGLPNRRFLHGKILAAVLATSVLVTLFVSLVVGALGVTVLKHHLGGFADSSALAYFVSIASSLVGVFVFLVAIYHWLPNTTVRFREALPAGQGFRLLPEHRGRLLVTMHWKLAADEALVLAFDNVDSFWMVTNMGAFWNSMDYAYRPVSYTPSRTAVDSDGRVRLVMTHDDPGYHNWLDTQAFEEGYLSFRHIGTRDFPPIETTVRTRFSRGSFGT